MKIVSIIGLFLIACGCQGPAKPDSFSEDQIIKEVENMLHAYHQAIEDNGLLAEFDFLDQSDSFYWVPPGYRNALDYDSVAIILKATDPTVAQARFHWDTLKVWPINDHLAQFYGTIDSEIVDTTGTESQGYLVETGMVIKRADGWKLLNGQSAFFTPL